MLLPQPCYNVIELDCYESPHRIFFASFNNDDNAFVQDLALELIICRKRKLSHVPVLRVEVADIATQTYQKNTKQKLLDNFICVFSLGTIFINGAYRIDFDTVHKFNNKKQLLQNDS